MEWIQLWAGITFAAQNGDVEGLLTAAAAGGLHLSDIVPRPGGFSARCAAWHYRKLAALARRRRVRLRIQKRQGLFFARTVPCRAGAVPTPLHLDATANSISARLLAERSRQHG